MKAEFGKSRLILGILAAAAIAPLTGLALDATVSVPSPTPSTRSPGSTAFTSLTLPMTTPAMLGPDERLITILQTNDIHGGVEPSRDLRTGSLVGGMPLWSGIVRSIRMGIDQQFGQRGGVLLVDAGDQFQGTLVSNYNEGQLVIANMNLLGYDAVIPGNHDYDFGPVGWLDDQVNPGNPDKNPRGALMRAMSGARFPMLSANTYFRDSLFDLGGNRVITDSVGCRTQTPMARIDWRRVRTLPFLRPFTIKLVSGVRVAIIGLDNPETPIVTTMSNVTDLCFDDPANAYRRTRAALEGRADVFIAVIHDGNTNTSDSVTQLVRNIRSTPAFTLDAVIAGHTHFVNNVMEQGVPIIQSGSGGKMFGRIDLVFSTTFRHVLPAKTRYLGGITMANDRCVDAAASFCHFEPTTQSLYYEGVPVVADPRVIAQINQAKALVAPIASRKLGVVEGGVVGPNRIGESPMGDAFSDLIREMSGADVTLINASGLRTPLAPGDVTYADLFEVLPFNNHGLIVGPMPAPRLVSLMAQSVQSCGAFGALIPSGLRVVYERNCQQQVNQRDPKARLLNVTTTTGEVLFDAARGIQPDPRRTFQVATFDFLAAGGEGYQGFRETPVISDFGILREGLTTFLLGRPMRLTPAMDGRLMEQVRGGGQPPAPSPSTPHAR